MFLHRYTIVSFFGVGSKMNRWFNFGISWLLITVVLPNGVRILLFHCTISAMIFGIWSLKSISVISIRLNEKWIPNKLNVVVPQSSFHLVWWYTWSENFWNQSNFFLFYIYLPYSIKCCKKNMDEPSRVSEVSSAYCEFYDRCY